MCEYLIYSRYTDNMSLLQLKVIIYYELFYLFIAIVCYYEINILLYFNYFLCFTYLLFDENSIYR